MGTRSITEFYDDAADTEAVTAIYRHWDGYPEEAGRDILRFIEEVKAQTEDRRFGAAPYLAAKYVVFLASMFAEDHEKPLAFLSVGVIQPGKDWGQEYVYRVICDGNPTVKAYAKHWETGELTEVEIPEPVKS